MLGATMHACAAREVELHGRCAARAPRDATRRRGHCHWLGALGTVGAVGVCLCRRRCPSGALPAAPDGVRAGGDRADLRGRERHVAEHAQVARHHLDLAIDAILDAVGRAELLHLCHERGVAVAWHRREEMVLELVLHAAPQPLGEGVGGDGVAGRLHLRAHPVVLVLVEEFLRLVRDRHDGRRHHAGEEDVAQRDGQRQAERHPRVVGEEQAALAAQPRADDSAERVEAPEGKKD